MEDMVTTQFWHFRYRFWPNNKSRMYLLEGTGEFIKTHQLKEGDMLQIYRDCKSGKHMIIGKKVLRPQKPPPSLPRPPPQERQHKPDDDCVSGVSTVSEDAPDLKEAGDHSGELEKFPSVEVGDEFIDEILGMVDGEEASSPEISKEDN